MNERVQELRGQRAIAKGITAFSGALGVGATASTVIQNGEPFSTVIACVGYVAAAGALLNVVTLSNEINRAKAK